VQFDVGGGAVIEGPLTDWLIVWAFMRGHERDLPFQRSLELVRSGSVAVDAGAHVGIWSLLAAKRGARVHAFEPVPETAARLRRHVERNHADGPVVNQVALGAEPGSVPFFAVTEGNTGASSFAPEPGSVELPVEVVTLDGYLERADVLKVDVEGAELLVFRGARRLLSSAEAPIVFFEVDDELCGRFGTSGRDAKQFVAECGYRIYRWNGSAMTEVGVDGPQPHEDLFAMKAARA
jgi:FkbM family methyltransferase